MRGVLLGWLVCACGNASSLPGDAGPNATDDATGDATDHDAPTDAAALTGFTIGGTALGIRSTVVLTLTTDNDSRHVAVNEDGEFQFPGSVPAGSSYAVTTTSSCDVGGGTGTDVQVNVATVQLLCGGLVELANVTFASGIPAVSFQSALAPEFDPGASLYAGTRPFFMDDSDTISVTPTAAYPTLASIDVYLDPTPSGQPSLPHMVGASVPIHLQHPTTLARTYQFTLVPAKPAQTAFVKASTPAAADSLGSVALSGDVLVVGAPNRGGTGAAVVLRRGATSWTEEQVVLPTAEAGARAGAAVAIDGDVLVVGVPLDATNNRGRAYVYRYDAATQTWALDGTLVGTPQRANANCGTSVAVSGSRIIIGCPGDRGTGNTANGGAVFMFQYDTSSGTWVADGTFRGANAGDELGSAVGLSASSAVVGAPYEDDGATSDAGGAHVLVRGTSSWSQQGATLRGALAAGANFGAAVGISGDYAIAGAPSMSSGVAYVFHRVADMWSQDGPALGPTLVVPELSRFGEAVAIDGLHVVVGSPRHDIALVDAGAVYAYRRESTGWTNSHMVNASDPSASRFGASVTLDGEWFVAGAPGESSVAPASGAVHVFR